MVIDNRIVIRKVRLVFSFQKDASGDVLFLVNIAAEIFLIVPRAQHRIADVKILCIVKTEPAYDHFVFFFSLSKATLTSVNHQSFLSSLVSSVVVSVVFSVVMVLFTFFRSGLVSFGRFSGSFYCIRCFIRIGLLNLQEFVFSNFSLRYTIGGVGCQ